MGSLHKRRNLAQQEQKQTWKQKQQDASNQQPNLQLEQKRQYLGDVMRHPAAGSAASRNATAAGSNC
jgi:hypothetical protein